ncbi:MAG: Ig-like domain-containing protein, partial [Gemmatimonadetes bacterium]|nr:Ig-like domain-containing protein [Gemmatimonadota bacterium]
MLSSRLLLPLGAAALTAAVAACAREAAPSGGPADRRPPVIVAVRPDTFARLEADDATIRIEFDETISENVASGTLDQAVAVSPQTGEVDVQHKGNALEVKIEGGLRSGVVYRITVAPVVQDRFNNTMLDPFEWVFSTGPDFQRNAIAGEVWDRVTGEPVPSMSVFALSEDSVPYVARTDSLGLFVMRYLPLGRYRLRSYDDRNLNGEPDPFEMQGEGEERALGAVDTVLTSFWVMIPDTTPPQLARGEKVDSTTVRLVFDDPLDPEQSLEGLVRGMYRDSGDTPGVLRALHAWEYRAYADSVREVRAAEAEAERAAEAEAAAEPSAAGDPPPGLPPGPPGVPLDTGAAAAAEPAAGPTPPGT